jgi:NIMA (never in mitosis gene a)-related kinase
MYIHYFLKAVSEGQGLPGGQGATGSYLSALKSFVTQKQQGHHKPFFYCIGGHSFTLDEIKHGILRGNKRSPHSYIQRSLSSGDPKAQLVKDLNDGRINFVCLDFPEIAEHTDCFPSEDDLNDRLDSFVLEILNAKVNVDTIQGEITLPKLLNTYKYDFCNGADEGMLRFVFRYYHHPDIEDEQIIKDVCNKKTMIIRYE